MKRPRHELESTTSTESLQETIHDLVHRSDASEEDAVTVHDGTNASDILDMLQQRKSAPGRRGFLYAEEKSSSVFGRSADAISQAIRSIVRRAPAAPQLLDSQVKDPWTEMDARTPELMPRLSSSIVSHILLQPQNRAHTYIIDGEITSRRKAPEPRTLGSIKKLIWQGQLEPTDTLSRDGGPPIPAGAYKEFADFFTRTYPGFDHHLFLQEQRELLELTRKRLDWKRRNDARQSENAPRTPSSGSVDPAKALQQMEKPRNPSSGGLVVQPQTPFQKQYLFAVETMRWRRESPLRLTLVVGGMSGILTIPVLVGMMFFIDLAWLLPGFPTIADDPVGAYGVVAGISLVGGFAVAGSAAMAQRMFNTFTWYFSHIFASGVFWGLVMTFSVMTATLSPSGYPPAAYLMYLAHFLVILLLVVLVHRNIYGSPLIERLN